MGAKKFCRRLIKSLIQNDKYESRSVLGKSVFVYKDNEINRYICIDFHINSNVPTSNAGFPRDNIVSIVTNKIIYFHIPNGRSQLLALCLIEIHQILATESMTPLLFAVVYYEYIMNVF